MNLTHFASAANRGKMRKTGAHRQALGKPYFNASARCELSYGRLRPTKHSLEPSALQGYCAACSV